MASTAWTPPDDPDPSEILHSTVADTRKGLYKQALTKHLWYHHNALKFDKGQGGVRLSFALSYWLELAAVYAPAMDAYVYTRDNAEISFRQHPGFHLFYDVFSLNNHLGEGIRTAELFAEIADKDLEMATRLYPIAEPDLIGLGHYLACGPFLDPDKRLATASKRFFVSKQHEFSIPDREIPTPLLARQRYKNDVGTIVTLLVLNDRSDDARAVCSTALEVIEDDDFRTTLGAAMTGHFPDCRSL